MHVILCISNEFLPVDSAKYQLEFRQVSVVRLRARFTIVDQISVQLNQVQR